MLAQKKENLQAYFKKRYTTENIVLGLVGDFREKEIQSLLGKAIWPEGDSEQEVKEEYSPGGNIFCYEREIKQYDFYLIAPLFSRSDPRLAAFSYLDTALARVFWGILLVRATR